MTKRLASDAHDDAAAALKASAMGQAAADPALVAESSTPEAAALLQRVHDLLGQAKNAAR